MISGTMYIIGTFFSGESGVIPELSRNRDETSSSPSRVPPEKIGTDGFLRNAVQGALDTVFSMKRFLRLTIILFLLTFLWAQADELKIVSLSPSLTELVFRLGKGSLLAGRSSACDYPAEALKLPVMGNFADPDAEKILHLKPDLVITNDLMRPGSDRILQRGGIRVIRKQCRNMTEYLQWVELLGRELNCPEAAEKEAARVKTALEKYKNEADKITSKKTVCWVIWDSPLMIAGSGSLPETVIGYAGGINIARDLHPDYIKVSKDWLLKNQPDVLVWTCSRPLDRKDRFWRSMNAVRRGWIVYAPDSPRPGPRLPDGIELLKREMVKFR